MRGDHHASAAEPRNLLDGFFLTRAPCEHDLEAAIGQEHVAEFGEAFCGPAFLVAIHWRVYGHDAFAGIKGTVEVLIYVVRHVGRHEERVAGFVGARREHFDEPEVFLDTAKVGRVELQRVIERKMTGLLGAGRRETVSVSRAGETGDCAALEDAVKVEDYLVARGANFLAQRHEPCC